MTKAWMVVVLVALAGCSGASQGSDAEDPIKSKIVDDPSAPSRGTSGAPNVGRVEGVVLHAAGYALAQVWVTILSLEGSALTDANGTFSIQSVPPGEQTIRVEKEGYKTVQRPIQVVAGRLTQAEVVLEPAVDPGDIEHFHDFWRGSDTFTVFEGSVALDADRFPPECSFVHAFTFGPDHATTRDCVNIAIIPSKGRIVAPGTANLTFDIEVRGATQPQDLEFWRLWFETRPDAHGEVQREYVDVKGTGGTYTYELPSADLADHGHEDWTEWRYWLQWQNLGSLATGSVHYRFSGEVDITITAHKGDMVLDPPHPKKWADGPIIEFTDFSIPTPVACLQPDVACNQRPPNAKTSPGADGIRCDYGCMLPDRGHSIPPGTTRLQFTVEHTWQASNTVHDPHAAPGFQREDFVIGYKTAAASPRDATWDDYTWLEPIREEETDLGVAQSYEIDVAPGETDAYYDRVSDWLWMPAVPGHEQDNDWRGLQCPAPICGYPRFQLTAMRAINDDLLQGS